MVTVCSLVMIPTWVPRGHVLYHVVMFCITWTDHGLLDDDYHGELELFRILLLRNGWTGPILTETYKVIMHYLAYLGDNMSLLLCYLSKITAI